MKKTIAFFGIIMVLALASSACSRHTCPAYRGSTVEVVAE